ncbi:MAG TPA: AI-2E family transporter [Patescibacteria group bacterium]
MDKKIVDNATHIIIRAIAIMALLWLLYVVRDIVALFFLSVILTATLDPAIDWMQKRKISRPVGVILIYLALLLLVVIFASIIIPPFISQFQSFTQNLPSYSETFTQLFAGIEKYANSYGIAFNSHEFLQNMFGSIFQSSGQLFSTTVSVFSFFIAMLAILALTFYMSVKEDSMNRFLVSITPHEYHGHIVSLSDRIKSKIGKWLAGQLMLMLIIFVLDFVALSIFHIPYALILALLAGLLEIVPYLGPIISATLAAMVGFLISPVTGLIVLAILTAIQQAESHIIVPQVMKKAVGLNPVVVILALLVGAQLGGTLGAILAVPVATAVGVLAGDIINNKKENSH